MGFYSTVVEPQKVRLRTSGASASPCLDQWYHKNYLDHVFAVSNEDGTTLERYFYSAYGEVKITDGSLNPRAQTAIDNHVLWNCPRSAHALQIGRLSSEAPMRMASKKHKQCQSDDADTSFYDYKLASEHPLFCHYAPELGR